MGVLLAEDANGRDKVEELAGKKQCGIGAIYAARQQFTGR
jgi:hypothetical protein